MRLFLVICCIIVVSPSSDAQVRQRKQELYRLVPRSAQLTPEQKKEAGLVFDRVRADFERPSASSLSKVLHRSVHLALPGTEQGQYSANQATQLLSTFLADVTVDEFLIQKSEDSIPSPYFSALLRITKGGREHTLNLYVSLLRSTDSWAVGYLSLY